LGPQITNIFYIKDGIGVHCIGPTINTVTQTVLDGFRNVVDSKVPRNLRSYSRNLFAGLAIDEIGDDVPNEKSRASKFRQITRNVGQCPT